jgi:hypothetical protein
MWATRWGARGRSVDRLGGGVAHPGLPRRHERLQDRVRDPSEGTTERRALGASEPHGPRSHQHLWRGQPSARSSRGTIAASGRKGNKKGWTSAAT